MLFLQDEYQVCHFTMRKILDRVSDSLAKGKATLSKEPNEKKKEIKKKSKKRTKSKSPDRKSTKSKSSDRGSMNLKSLADIQMRKIYDAKSGMNNNVIEISDTHM